MTGSHNATSGDGSAAIPAIPAIPAWITAETLALAHFMAFQIVTRDAPPKFTQWLWDNEPSPAQEIIIRIAAKTLELLNAEGAQHGK